jgi:hypothetical protein
MSSPEQKVSLPLSGYSLSSGASIVLTTEHARGLLLAVVQVVSAAAARWAAHHLARHEPTLGVERSQGGVGV